MNTEDVDSLYYSHQKMSVMLQDVTDLKDRDKIVTEFIKSSKDIRIGDFPKGL